MMFRYSLPRVSMAIALAGFPSSVPAICLPCQAAFRRSDAVHQMPFSPREETDWAPRILNPSYQSVWFKGVRQAVTWNFTNMPSHVSNPDCQVYLARWDSATGDYGQVYHDHPLAPHCRLRDGNTTIMVPQEDWLKAARNYVIILVGNLGDHSAPFTIADPPESKP